MAVHVFMVFQQRTMPDFWNAPIYFPYLKIQNLVPRSSPGARQVVSLDLAQCTQSAEALIPAVKAFPSLETCNLPQSQMGRKLTNSLEPYIMAGLTSWPSQSERKEKLKRVHNYSSREFYAFSEGGGSLPLCEVEFVLFALPLPSPSLDAVQFSAERNTWGWHFNHSAVSSA